MASETNPPDSNVYQHSPNHTKLASQKAGGCWQIALGSVLVLVGSFFTWYLASVWNTSRITHTWIETPTQIVSSFIHGERPTPNSPPSFSLEVRYPYEFQGTKYEGYRVKTVPLRTSSKKRVEKVQSLFPAGKHTVCYVNPDHPEESVLQKSSLAAGYSIWFPLLFVIGGLVMMFRSAFQLVVSSKK